MGDEAGYSVGLRQLRHETSAVIARVSQGETLDVTAHGRLVARIVPAAAPATSPLLDVLIEEGRLIPAERPGYRPEHRSNAYGDRLSEALSALRDEENW